MPSKTTSDTEYDINWTYADDADFIDKFFMLQLIALFICLVTSNFGCCKCGNSANIRDSQVTASMANSNIGVPKQKYQEPKAAQQDH